jgi:hypothetical protein
MPRGLRACSKSIGLRSPEKLDDHIKNAATVQSEAIVASSEVEGATSP